MDDIKTNHKHILYVSYVDKTLTVKFPHGEKKTNPIDIGVISSR